MALDPILGAPAGALYVEGYPSTITDRVEHRRPRRVRQHQGRQREHRSPILAYAELLDELGLEDPTGAVETFRRARRLRASAPTAPQAPRAVSRDAVAAVASGETSIDSVEVTDFDAERARREHRARFDALHAAADLAHTEAARALHAAGDDLVEMFRPIIDAAVANPFDVREAPRWDRIHDLLDKLRPWAIPGAEGAHRIDYRFARPDLVHQHQLQHCEKVRSVGHEVIGWADDRPRVRVFRIAHRPDPIPLHVIGEHPEWKPGLYTATQVIDHAATFAPPEVDDQVRIAREGA